MRRLDAAKWARGLILLPGTPTIRLDFAVLGPTIPPLLARDAGIAQLVEHDLAKVGVASSSLVSRSIPSRTVRIQTRLMA